MDAFNYATQVDSSVYRKPKKIGIVANFDLCESYLNSFLGESECKHILSIAFADSIEEIKRIIANVKRPSCALNTFAIMWRRACLYV